MEHTFLNKIKNLQEKYPDDNFVLHDLYHDCVDQTEKAHWKFQKLLFVSWGGLFAYTGLRGPLPILRRQGRILGTHRVFRQYLYVLAGCAAVSYYPLLRTISKTEAKLDLVDKNKQARDEGYVRPKLPLYSVPN